MYNVKVASFAVSLQTTFTAGPAQGCYVARGAADGPGMINRIEITPTGLVYDPDGSGRSHLTPPTIWQEFVFQAAHPNGHTQYKNLVNLVGWRGTLTLETPGSSTQAQKTVTARLLPLRGTWEAPFRIGASNELVIRAEWQLTGLLTV